MELSESLKAYHHDARVAVEHLQFLAKSINTADDWLYTCPSLMPVPAGLKMALEGLFAANAQRPVDNSPEHRAMIRGARDNGTAGIEVGGCQYVSAHAAVFALVNHVLTGVVSFALTPSMKAKTAISPGNWPAEVDLSGMEIVDVEQIVWYFSVFAPLPKSPDDLRELLVLLDLEYAAALDVMPIADGAVKSTAVMAKREAGNSKRPGGKSTLERDIAFSREYDGLLEDGEITGVADYARQKGMARDTMSKALGRGKAARDGAPRA